MFIDTSFFSKSCVAITIIFVLVIFIIISNDSAFVIWTEEGMSKTEVEMLAEVFVSFSFSSRLLWFFRYLTIGAGFGLRITEVSKQNEKLDPILSEYFKVNPWFVSVFESSRHCFPIQTWSFSSLLEAIVGVSKQKARHVIHAAVRRLTRRPRGLTLVLNFFTTCSWEP